MFIGISCLHISPRFVGKRRLWRGQLFPLFPSHPFRPGKLHEFTLTSSWFGKIPYPPPSTTYWVYSSRPHELNHFAGKRGGRLAYLNAQLWTRAGLFYVPPSWYLARLRGMRNIEMSAEGLSRAPPIVYLFKWKQGLNEKDTW